MTPFTYNDFPTLETSPASPNHLHTCISNLVFSSVNAKAKVESVNPITGQYRIILTGTLHNTPVGTVSPNFNG